MNALNSLVKIFLLVLVMFGVCGWLIRGHFELTEELQAAHAQAAALEARLIQDANSYQSRIAELEQSLASTQEALGQYEQLLLDYEQLQHQMAQDAQSIQQLQQMLAAEQAARVQVEVALRQQEAAYESLRQGAANDLQMCLNRVAGSQVGQTGAQTSLQVAALSQADVGAGMLAFTLPLGALGLGALGIRFGRSCSRWRVGSGRGVSTRERPVGMQPLILRPKRRSPSVRQETHK